MSQALRQDRAHHNRRPILARIGCLFVCLALAACNAFAPPSSPTPTSSPRPATPTPRPTLSPTPTLTFTPAGPLPVWGTYPAPTLTPATPIPSPLSGLNLPDEVQIAVLLGADQEAPYMGRTDAILLVLYNPRLTKAALIAVPGELFVYIPGYTMQRINAAFAVGGIRLLEQTLQYNLGLRPEKYVLAHPSDFVDLVNDLNGLNTSVLVPMPDACGGIPGGMVFMDGSTALCYATTEDPTNVLDRTRRQLELTRALFLRLVTNGNLIQITDLYQKYSQRMSTDFPLYDLITNLSLGLKLADPGRMAYFQIGAEQTSPWQVNTQATVLLPKRSELQTLLQQAINSVMAPAPLSDIVSTLAYELTVSPTPTETFTATPTPTRTFTPKPTRTRTFTPTYTRTPTAAYTSTFTLTPSQTPTPTLSPAPSNTSPPTLTPSPSETPTETPTPSPTGS